MEAIGQRVCALRKERGITQQALGNAIDVRQTTISEIEGGRNQPSLAVLCKLADFFGVHPGYFLDDAAVTTAQAE